MSNIFLFCMRSVCLIWFQLFVFSCEAHQYQIDSSKLSLVFIVDAKNHIASKNWNKIQHYIKLIVDEFDKHQSDIIDEYRFIENGW